MGKYDIWALSYWVWVAFAGVSLSVEMGSSAIGCLLTSHDNLMGCHS